MDDGQDSDQDAATPADGAPKADPVDLAKLVEKVRELMREDLFVSSGPAARPWAPFNGGSDGRDR